MRSLRESWKKIVTAEDYEGHMAEVGQAEANAVLVRDLITVLDLRPDSRLLFAGAGPGQMFDYVDGRFLQNFDLTFTDINQEFLDRLRGRLDAAGLPRARVVNDDVENPSLRGPFDWTVLVLILEHVDWRKALDNLAAITRSGFVVIVQKNPEGMETAVSPHRKLRPSIEKAMEGEHPELLEFEELKRHLVGLGFECVAEDFRPVADAKMMCGFIFQRRTHAGD